MRFPNLFRPKAPAVPASVALPPPSRAPPVVESMVIVAADGAKTFLCNLKPEEVFSASASFISWLADEDRGKFARLPSEAYTAGPVAMNRKFDSDWRPG
jgi:hypothetical protein